MTSPSPEMVKNHEMFVAMMQRAFVSLLISLARECGIEGLHWFSVRSWVVNNSIVSVEIFCGQSNRSRTVSMSVESLFTPEGRQKAAKTHAWKFASPVDVDRTKVIYV